MLNTLVGPTLFNKSSLKGKTLPHSLTYLVSSKSSAREETAMSSVWARALICQATFTHSRMNGWMMANVVSGGRKMLGFTFNLRITSCTSNIETQWLHTAQDMSQNTVVVLHENIDQTLMNLLHCLLNCEIGGLDCSVITTEYISRVIE